MGSRSETGGRIQVQKYFWRAAVARSQPAAETGTALRAIPFEPRALEASRRDAGRADSGSEAGRRSRRIPNSRWRISTRRSGRAARSACASPPLDRFRLGTSPQELVASKEPGSPLVALRFPPPRSERSTPPPSPRSCDRAPDNDIARLKRAYTNEKCAPELLPFEADLVSRVTEQVEHQEGTVSSARAAAAAGSGAGADDLMAHIYHAELNRVRFLLRAYYRTRLFKIERNAVHVLKEPEVLERLSEQEREYATNYANAVEEHFGAALGQMPDRYASMLQQIEEEDGEWDMVPSPNLDAHVFARVREDRGEFIIDPDDPENTMDLTQGDILMIRYRLIKRLLEEGGVDLI